MFFIYLNALTDPEDKFIITRIYHEYHNLMGMTAKRMLDDHQLAEDAVQHTFVKLINNVSTVKMLPADKIRPYIFIALENVIFDIMKQNKNFCADYTPSEKVPADVCIEDEVTASIQLQVIIAEIRELHPNDVTILELTYSRPYRPGTDVSKSLCCSNSAVSFLLLPF